MKAGRGPQTMPEIPVPRGEAFEADQAFKVCVRKPGENPLGKQVSSLAKKVFLMDFVGFWFQHCLKFVILLCSFGQKLSPEGHSTQPLCSEACLNTCTHTHTHSLMCAHTHLHKYIHTHTYPDGRLSCPHTDTHTPG